MNKIMHKSILSLLGVTIITSLVLLSTNVSADDSAVTVTTITVPIACTLNGVGTTHTATLSPNTYSGATGSEYENGIGKTTLTAICNDDNGFAIYAIGYTGNEYGATNLIGENTAGTIATKAYQSGDTTSNWSMKLTKLLTLLNHIIQLISPSPQTMIIIMLYQVLILRSLSIKPTPAPPLPILP